METKQKSVTSISIKYGLLTALGLMLFFLFMKLVGLVYMVELRVLNFVILILGIYFSLRDYKKQSIQEMNYFDSLGIGMRTTAIAVLPFALFILIYLLIDIHFMQYLKENALFGQYLNPYILGFVIAFEGLISGFLGTYAALQYMKKTHLKNA